jgi:hypothetical protein
MEPADTSAWRHETKTKDLEIISVDYRENKLTAAVSF